ncbi:MAG: hypothetical protein OEO79_12640 [Gemmatimonadota bacterium]|nr:hypothetical protein [Gemmatimonadota bacterium]
MLPEPLHPAVVHFPIVFATLLPVSALVALWMIRRGAEARRAWALPFVLALALTGSSWVAIETGEAEEDRVENIVGDAPLHAHEEAAERLLLIAGLVSLVAGVGLLSGTVGTAARLVATAGTVVVLAAGVQVGSLGGELVYEHGAAAAYTTESGTPAGPTWPDEDESWEGH